LGRVDNIYMSSDGIQDRFGGAEGGNLKIRRLKRLIVELSQQNISTQKVVLRDTFSDWKEDQEQEDYVCLIGINVANDL